LAHKFSSGPVPQDEKYRDGILVNPLEANPRHASKAGVIHLIMAMKR